MFRDDEKSRAEPILWIKSKVNLPHSLKDGQSQYSEAKNSNRLATYYDWQGSRKDNQNKETQREGLIEKV